MADGKNGRMVEWWEWLHTYYLRYTHTGDTDDDDDDNNDTLIFYSIDLVVEEIIFNPSHGQRLMVSKVSF